MVRLKDGKIMPICEKRPSLPWIKLMLEKLFD